MAYGPWNLAQSSEGGFGVLTVGRDRREGRCSGGIPVAQALNDGACHANSRAQRGRGRGRRAWRGPWPPCEAPPVACCGGECREHRKRGGAGFCCDSEVVHSARMGRRVEWDQQQERARSGGGPGSRARGARKKEGLTCGPWLSVGARVEQRRRAGLGT